jgi:aromatic ring-opening dioxygenase catalytic subunit (LigB family)
MGPAAAAPSGLFDEWLRQTIVETLGEERLNRLKRWASAPAARIAHPREDHLIPLMVACGAASEEAARRIHHQQDFFGAVTISSFRFG